MVGRQAVEDVKIPTHVLSVTAAIPTDVAEPSRAYDSRNYKLYLIHITTVYLHRPTAYHSNFLNYTEI